MSLGQTDITVLLKAWAGGDREALDRLTPLVYDQLRRLAGHYIRHERQGHTMGGTALVHEAYLRLIDASRVDWKDRAHFFAVAARMMRRILIDAARARAAYKRGGTFERVEGPEPIDLDSFAAAGTDTATELVALDDALNELAVLDPRRAQVVELRFFGDLSAEETAQVLGISTQTVTRDWKTARAWLGRELRKGRPRDTPPS